VLVLSSSRLGCSQFDCFKVFQLYVRGDDAWVDEHVERAIKAGYDAFCITVDTAVISRRERDVAKRWTKPWQRVWVLTSLSIHSIVD